MLIKTRSGAYGKTYHKRTTSELPVKKKKLRKTVLPKVDEEEKDNELPLIKRTKALNKAALNLPI